MKLYLALLTLLPTIHAACYTPPKPQTHDSKPQSNTPKKRAASPQTQTDDLLDALPFDPLSGPSAITIDLPPQFLPPPWTPTSGLDSPYGVSPWDDSGSSQMTDNSPSIWRQCPKKHLDCRKCPRDWRCRRAVQAADIAPEDDGNSKCPIAKCDAGGVQCGVKARCTRGYCVCDLGMTGSSDAYRGTEGLGKATVYVGPGVDCNTPCDGLSCKEVAQLDDGVCYKSGDTSDEFEDEKELPGPTYGGVMGNVTINGQTFDLHGTPQ
ncbi:hypothetical protein HBI56_197300 [Parastagonospora nodorum]|nr:hypothetical protein HBH53_198690 [Parastagonospora nodorum]KAH3960408.1 hypothetical protein HBH51_192640 [Parastagonospora nodorum]KAH3965246.1 hypothetical protein HBH52_207520 [Parastagonospora nodorum]KAH3992438.1 hypothetical protein HBI10_218160 [Parastagonospora nodorum]KAH4010170.1 hypothetical protein HBI13_210220 [Parastagonospora nodorum]